MAESFARVCRTGESVFAPLAAVFINDSGFPLVGTERVLVSLIARMEDRHEACAIYKEGLKRLQWAESLVEAKLFRADFFPFMRDEYLEAFARKNASIKRPAVREQAPAARIDDRELQKTFRHLMRPRDLKL